MKKYIYTTFIFITAILVSCETNEKFSGSPVGNQEIITLDATITSDVEFAAGGQDVEFNVVLPQTFKDTAKVEITTINATGGRTKANVEILPGQVSPVELGKIKSPGSGRTFSSQFDMSITAISLRHAEIGKHYLIKSNIKTIGTGATGIEDANPIKLSVELVWPNVSSTNDLSLVITKPTLTVVAPISNQSGGKLHSIRVASLPNSLNNDPNNSNAEGDYIFEMTGKSFVTSPIDMPYRVVIVYPDGKVEFINGIYQGLFVNAPLRPLLKINKSVVDGVVVFTSTPL